MHMGSSIVRAVALRRAVSSLSLGVALLAGPVWAQSVPATETPAADAPETAAGARPPAATSW
jgi:hypothetical protein